MGKNKKHKKDKKSKKKKHHKEKAETKTDSSKKKSSKSSKKSVEEVATKNAQDADYDIPLELMSNKVRAPETPEEYQKRQNRIRYEVDPVTGRKRLIKGDGEILEEIVSRKRHVGINQQATHEDGNFFQYNTTGKNNQHFSP